MYTNSYDALLNVRNGFPVFTTVLEANYVAKQEDRFAAFKLTDEDKQELHRLARDPRIGARPSSCSPVREGAPCDPPGTQPLTLLVCRCSW